jgi:putative redox protein
MGDVRVARLDWTGDGLHFEGRGTVPETPSVAIDGGATAGPSPMLTLLLAAAGCTAADVVVILEKMRVRPETFSVEVEGTRRAVDPKRYESVTLRYRIGGGGVTRSQAERAVGLSLEKYCSVMHSLAPDIAVEHEIDLA